MDTPDESARPTPVPPEHDRVNLLGLTPGGLERYFQARGERPFRAVQVLKWIHQQRVTDFSAMTNLGKDLRARLADEASVRLPEIVAKLQTMGLPKLFIPKVDQFAKVDEIPVLGTGKLDLRAIKEVALAVTGGGERELTLPRPEVKPPMSEGVPTKAPPGREESRRG